MEKILKIISENPRLTNEQIAAMVDSTAADVARCIEQYERDGIIKGYRAIVDWAKVDAQHVQAFIELRVSPKKDRGFDEIADMIVAFPEVESVTLMSGGYDLAVVITGKSFQEIAMFVAKRLSPLDGVLSTATHFVLQKYKDSGTTFTGPVEEDGRVEIL